jgi:hypothetical protein
MTTAFSKEFNLAAACARWPPSDRRTEAIRAAAARPLDWPRFLRVARRHQLIGLIHQGLTAAQLDMPLVIATQLGAEAAALLRANLAVARESLRIQRLFKQADIPVLFVKGAPLAVLAFGNLGLRSAQDIDLLVSYEALPAATALLLDAGYLRFDPPLAFTDAQLQLLMPIRKDVGFIHQSTGRRIELHWRLFLNSHAMALGSITTASQIVHITAAEGLRTLGEEDLFAYLCMHGALHWWNRLKWLADVNALLASTPEDGTERLVRAAEVRGVGPAAAQALLLCRNLLKAPLPASLMVALDKGTTLRWLEATALKAMTAGRGERDPHDARFGTTRGSLSTFLLSRSWRYRMAEMNNHLMNARDVLALRLPGRLRFLYPVLRIPLWIRRHAARRRPVN